MLFIISMAMIAKTNISLFIFCAYILPETFCQTPTELKGFVCDNGGKRIPFAKVQIDSIDEIFLTDKDGYFTIKRLIEGNHYLKVSAQGYQPFKKIVSVSREQLNIDPIILTETIDELDNVVITASRITQNIDNVSIPFLLIPKKKIENSGYLRLDEILQEETGLIVNSDHGEGIQIQGLNSEYILILIDGEPVIGRTAGTLDLSRIALNNIDRIEIVKGPSSSLYGSSAMGGVINVITKNPPDGFSLNVGTKYRSFNTLNASAEIGYKEEKYQFNLFYNRLSSDGYDLDPSSLEKTVPQYVANTYQFKSKLNISPQANFSISGRYYTEPQIDYEMISLSDGLTTTKTKHIDNAERVDWNILPKIEWKVGDDMLITARQYLSDYQTERKIIRLSDNSLFNLDLFTQKFSRTELQIDLYPQNNHILTFGLGNINESVNSTRYADSTFSSQYVFFQYQWDLQENLNFAIGGRYDNHEAYGENISPKLTLAYNFNNHLKLKFSFGAGFKAPDFRQLLLDFTNPTVGYSVLGTAMAVQGIEQLIERGETFRFDSLTNLNAIDNARANAQVANHGLKAERSFSFNLGLNYRLNEELKINANIFRNNIYNLIDTWSIAQKNNNQFVYSYRNIDDLVTQGIEIESTINLNNQFKLSVGYQFLDSFDKTVLEQIDNGLIAYRPPGEIISRRVIRSDYQGLFGRSKHSGNFKIAYKNDKLHLDVFIRAIYRGRWGFGDLDGNQILVGNYELAKGYTTLNFNVQKRLKSKILFDAGVNNLLDTINEFEPSVPGRICFLGIKYNLNKI